MPRIQYESESDEEDIIIVKGLKNKVKQQPIPEPKQEPKQEPEIIEIPENQPIKEKKISKKTQKDRSIKQLETTRLMRESLKERREADLRIKEQVRLEHEENKNKLKIKKDKADKKVIKRYKKIIESSSDEEESEDEEIEEPIIKKKFPSNPKTKPEIKKNVQPVRTQPAIRFF